MNDFNSKLILLNSMKTRVFVYIAHGSGGTSDEATVLNYILAITSLLTQQNWPRKYNMNFFIAIVIFKGSFFYLMPLFSHCLDFRYISAFVSRCLGGVFLCFYGFWWVFICILKAVVKFKLCKMIEKVTCECFCTGIDSCQPFWGTKVRDLQDTTVGVD